jgi:glycosyltransferase involved in cell wall biosynthesis
VKASVLIPAYNCARTIGATLDSVLRQTTQPFEILVLDDGSTDDTPSILRSYGPRIRLLEQKNSGVASARNILCREAAGDLIAFLDADDLWHPAYLETQIRNLSTHPDLVAVYSGHVDLYGYGPFDWPEPSVTDEWGSLERLTPVEFLSRYHSVTGLFGMSWMCVPTEVVRSLGTEPFKVSGAEDAYFCTSLALLGSVGRSTDELALYRLTEESQSANRLKVYGECVHAFEVLESRFDDSTPEALHTEFARTFASKRRQYAKHLMGAGLHTEARQQLRMSLSISRQPAAVVKSTVLLALTYLPERLQPTWPQARRRSKESAG